MGSVSSVESFFFSFKLYKQHVMEVLVALTSGALFRTKNILMPTPARSNK